MKTLPRHFKFQDKNHGEVVFIQDGDWIGWLFRKDPNNPSQWISMRLANKADLDKVSRTMAVMN